MYVGMRCHQGRLSFLMQRVDRSRTGKVSKRRAWVSHYVKSPYAVMDASDQVRVVRSWKELAI